MSAAPPAGRTPRPVLRRLTAADASAYRALMLTAYARHPEAFTSSAAERARLSLAWWQARLTDDPLRGETVWGAWHGLALVGAVGLRPDTTERTRHRAELYGMVVAPAWRGQGLGQALLQAVRDEATHRVGLRQLRLSVSAGNEAARCLYTQAGFALQGHEPQAVRLGDDLVDKLRLTLSLPVETAWLALDDSELAQASLEATDPASATHASWGSATDDPAVLATVSAWPEPPANDAPAADAPALTLRLSAAQVWRQAPGAPALPGHLSGLSLRLSGLLTALPAHGLASLQGRLRQARVWHPTLSPQGTPRLPLPLPAAWAAPMPEATPWRLALLTAQGDTLEVRACRLALHWPVGARWHESLAC